MSVDLRQSLIKDWGNSMGTAVAAAATTPATDHAYVVASLTYSGQNAGGGGSAGGELGGWGGAGGAEGGGGASG
eukprot:258143-Prymnesium_polylepis.1